MTKKTVEREELHGEKRDKRLHKKIGDCLGRGIGEKQINDIEMQKDAKSLATRSRDRRRMNESSRIRIRIFKLPLILGSFRRQKNKKKTQNIIIEKNNA